MQSTMVVHELVMAIERDRESYRAGRQNERMDARRGHNGRHTTGKRAIQEMARTMAGRFAGGRLAPRRNPMPALHTDMNLHSVEHSLTIVTR